MRKLVLVSVILAAAAISGAMAEEPRTLEEAKVLAAQKNLLVLADFSTTW